MVSVNNNPQVYRFKFSDTIVEMLTSFAKLHANDDRHTYKDAWSVWWTTNADVLEYEVRRLQTLGYDGSVEDKMYKAGRYYFRGKNTAKTKVKPRRAYVAMTPEMIEAMDAHIDTVMTEEEFSPARGYDWFCASHQGLLRTEIVHLRNAGILDDVELISKVRKTYKNRYFLCRSN
tara:strand:- start:363 stop:887 length:525 start_codon:yes stop_codon:yes gene_type:complete